MSKKPLSLVSGNHFSFFVKHFQGVTVYPVTAFGVGPIIPFHQQDTVFNGPGACPYLGLLTSLTSLSEAKPG
jgi:hypothetical protein